LKRIFLFFAMVAAVLTSHSASSQSSPFQQRLLQNRYQIAVQDRHLSGTGLPVLQDALKNAQFVLLGEDHGIAQIPRIDSAIYEMIAPQGFNTFAIEVGPLVGHRLQSWVAQKDGRAQLAAFDKQYPFSIAFYGWSEEYDLLAKCPQFFPGKCQIWGLDQELMGSGGVILQAILDTHPGPEATKEAQTLLQENADKYAVAAKSGNPGDLFMMSATDTELNHLKELLAKEANPQSQALVASLIASREIYQKNMSNNGFESNRQRALLMKSTFHRNYQNAAHADGKPAKIVFKYGFWHMYKGFNPLHNNDMGNLVAELADALGARSIHIGLLGVRGKQLKFAGMGRPFEAAELNLREDKDFLYLKPMFDNLASDGFTLFDLRAFRKEFSSLGPIDKELERLIFGYDFLILIPNAAPSHAM
jgi:hypothetical protein